MDSSQINIACIVILILGIIVVVRSIMNDWNFSEKCKWPYIVGKISDVTIDKNGNTHVKFNYKIDKTTYLTTQIFSDMVTFSNINSNKKIRIGENVVVHYNKLSPVISYIFLDEPSKNYLYLGTALIVGVIAYKAYDYYYPDGESCDPTGYNERHSNKHSNKHSTHKTKFYRNIHVNLKDNIRPDNILTNASGTEYLSIESASDVDTSIVGSSPGIRFQ